MPAKTRAQLIEENRDLKDEVRGLKAVLSKSEEKKAMFKAEMKRLVRQIKKKGLTSLIDVGGN